MSYSEKILKLTALTMYSRLLLIEVIEHERGTADPIAIQAWKLGCSETSIVKAGGDLVRRGLVSRTKLKTSKGGARLMVANMDKVDQLIKRATPEAPETKTVIMEGQL